MFMRVNSKCAHQVRPPLRPEERRELRHSESIDSARLAYSVSLLAYSAYQNLVRRG
jgi:hypothetical protein